MKDQIMSLTLIFPNDAVILKKMLCDTEWQELQENDHQQGRVSFSSLIDFLTSDKMFVEDVVQLGQCSIEGSSETYKLALALQATTRSVLMSI